MCGGQISGKVGGTGEEKGESSVSLTCTFEKSLVNLGKSFRLHLYGKHQTGLGR